MSKFTRTACCKKCGSTELKIIPKVGEVEYKCLECGSHVATVEYDDYKTLSSRCEQCNNDIFKVKITKGEEEEDWDALCSKCQTEAKEYYIDEKGNPIDKKTRELLIIKKSILNLQNKIEFIEDELYEINVNINSMDSRGDNLENKVNYLDAILDSHEYDINHLDSQINQVKRDIYNCENNIDDIRNRIRDFE